MRPPVLTTMDSMCAWMSSSVPQLTRPRAMTAWLLTTTTGQPSPARRFNASRLPGRNSNSAHDLTWSARLRLMTPSRSRKMAGRSILLFMVAGGPFALRAGVVLRRPDVHQVRLVGDDPTVQGLVLVQQAREQVAA